MRLSIIIPVYNEESTILRVIARVRAVVLETPLGGIVRGLGHVPIEREIIVVDDASTDGTRPLLAGVQDRQDVVTIFHARNRGKGAAVRTGLQYARGDLIVIQNADLEYDPSEYPRLLHPILDGQAQAVYGSRFFEGRPLGMSISHTMGNRFLTAIANRLYGCMLTDVLTCYKAFTREVAAQLELRATRWDIDAELTVQILGLGYAIHEIPISYCGRTLQQGKKLRWWAGLSILHTLMRCWLPHEAKSRREIVRPGECVVAGALRDIRGLDLGSKYRNDRE